MADFENLFVNDKFKEEIDALYKKAEKIYNSEGKRYPILQNNNFIRGDEKPKSISLWLNEKDGKKFITYKREDKKEQSQSTGYKDKFNDTPF